MIFMIIELSVCTIIIENETILLYYYNRGLISTRVKERMANNLSQRREPYSVSF